MPKYPGQKGYFVSSFSGKSKKSGNEFNSVTMIEFREDGKADVCSYFPDVMPEIATTLKFGDLIEYTVSIGTANESKRLVSIEKVLKKSPFDLSEVSDKKAG